MAAQKFNDEDWQPPHLFPNDPHLARCRAFTPSKKSKEVDPNYLREKYKALRRQFNNSVKRWEEGGHSKIENFWKCSGMAPGTSDEGCWYMFLVLWVGKHEDVLAVVLDKHMDHSPHPQSLGMFSSAKFDLRERSATNACSDISETNTAYTGLASGKDPSAFMKTFMIMLLYTTLQTLVL